MAVQPDVLIGALATVWPRIVWRVPTTQPLVALSFDDGPSPRFTPAVLDTLARHRVHATFFLIGRHAQAHPELLARIRAEGHEIANHASSLAKVRGWPLDRFEADVRETERVLGLAGPYKLYRPPSGLIRDDQIDRLDALGYRCVLGSVHPYDGAHPPAAYDAWLVARRLAPGAIVVLHDGIPDASRTVEALEPILEAAESRGLRVVPVGTLLRAAQ